MHKTLQFITLFYILFLSLVFGKTETEVLRIDYPKYIPISTSFIITSQIQFKSFDESDLELTFRKNFSLKLEEVVIESTDESYKIDYEINQNDIKLNLFNLKRNLYVDQIYTLKFVCRINEAKKFSSDILWYGDNRKSVQKINDFNNILDDRYLVECYKPINSAGKSLRLDKDGKLEFTLNQTLDLNSLLIEFWMKQENVKYSFLTITNLSENDTLFKMELDKNHSLKLISKNDLMLGKHISNNTWNYFALHLTNEFGRPELDVYNNSDIIYKTEFSSVSDVKKLKFNFSNYGEESKIELERLKIWNFGNSIQLAKNEKHFMNYEADSSSVIFSSNFEYTDEFKDNNSSNKQIEVSSQNIKYVKSDAPIFSKAPKINVTIGNSYNSIVWYVQEYSSADEFILEKGDVSGKYNEIFNTYAEDDPLKIYYYTEEVLATDEVAFYRIKQVNKDGSEVYSEEVKIGHSNVTEFTLEQNYPNPFNPITNIYVEVTLPAKFEVKVYDLVGNLVEQLHKGYLSQGMHTFEFDGSSLPSGIYFYEVISPNSQSVKKMILAK